MENIILRTKKYILRKKKRNMISENFDKRKKIESFG